MYTINTPYPVRKMKNKDAVTKSYMKDNVRFADIMNYCLYDGRKVIRPENLRELDTAMTALPHAKSARSYPVQKYRDLLKYLYGMTDGTVVYLILGIENQSHVHYAMPVRNMLYDAGQYAEQVRKAEDCHAAKGEESGTDDEYLSGFFKNDTLVPVVTLVIFWSAKPWDGPRSLHEMFGDRDSGVLAHVPDYRINLIAPREMTEEDFEHLSSELKQVLRFIKHSENKKKMKETVYADNAFRVMNRESVELLNTVTGAGIRIKTREEKVDMCAGIQGMIDDAVEAEQKRMAAETAEHEAGLIRNIMRNMGLTADFAMDAAGVPEERRAAIRMYLK